MSRPSAAGAVYLSCVPSGRRSDCWPPPRSSATPTACRAHFVFDDRTAIVECEPIRSLWSADRLANLRGLVDFSFAVNYAVGGLEPAGYHVVNIIIHLLTGLTLFGLVRRTLDGHEPARRGDVAADSYTGGPVIGFRDGTVVAGASADHASGELYRAALKSAAALFYLFSLYAFCRAPRGRRPKNLVRAGARQLCAQYALQGDDDHAAARAPVVRSGVCGSELARAAVAKMALSGPRRCDARDGQRHARTDATDARPTNVWRGRAGRCGRGSAHRAGGRRPDSLDVSTVAARRDSALPAALFLAGGTVSRLLLARGQHERQIVPSLLVVAMLFGAVVWTTFRYPAIGFVGGAFLSVSAADVERHSDQRFDGRASHVPAVGRGSHVVRAAGGQDLRGRFAPLDGWGQIDRVGTSPGGGLPRSGGDVAGGANRAAQSRLSFHVRDVRKHLRTAPYRGGRTLAWPACCSSATRLPPRSARRILPSGCVPTWPNSGSTGAYCAISCSAMTRRWPISTWP